MRTDEFWALLGVDKFGRAACEPLNCGAGLAIEDEHGSSEDSYMLVLEDVTAKGFRDFLSALAATGRAETFRREFNGNIFAEFKNGDRIIYTYLTAEKQQARIILDNSSCPLAEMNDTEADVRGDTALM